MWVLWQDNTLLNVHASQVPCKSPPELRTSVATDHCRCPKAENKLRVEPASYGSTMMVRQGRSFHPFGEDANGNYQYLPLPGVFKVGH